MGKIDVEDVTEPGWYMSADPRLRESIVYLASDQTIDRSIRWFAFFDNGDGGPAEVGYIAQAGPLVRLTRPTVRSQGDPESLLTLIG